MDWNAKLSDADQSHNQRRQVNPFSDPDVTITASDLPVVLGEDPIQIAVGDEVSSNVLVPAAERLTTRFNN